MPPQIPTAGSRTTLDPDLKAFLSSHPNLRLGSSDFSSERSHHTEVFGFHNLETSKQAPIGKVEFTGIRGPHGTIPLRVFYPSSTEEKCKNGKAAALVYMHGGGYTVGGVDDFENGLRIVTEESGVVVVGVEHRLAPEWKFPVQLDELNDEAKTNIAGQMLLYPEARVPFDTKAGTENNSGLYLECNGIFSFANNYIPRGTTPAHRYISPGMQSVDKLKGLPPACVYTCGFDPLRDVGVEYAHSLEEAGNKVSWHHYDTLTHGFLQLAPWSEKAMEATKQVGKDLQQLAYG